MALWYEASLFALEVGVQVQIPVGLLRFFSHFFFYLMFTLWLVSVYLHC